MLTFPFMLLLPLPRIFITCTQSILRRESPSNKHEDLAHVNIFYCRKYAHWLHNTAHIALAKQARLVRGMPRLKTCKKCLLKNFATDKLALHVKTVPKMVKRKLAFEPTHALHFFTLDASNLHTVILATGMHVTLLISASICFNSSLLSFVF